MAHLYQNHTVTIANPDDEDFDDYETVAGIHYWLDYLTPLITSDERGTLQHALNTHYAGRAAGVRVQLNGVRGWRMYTVDE